MKCIYDNVHDIQLKAWIFRIFNRGFMYYLTQYFNEVIDVSLKIWSFISEFVSIVLTYSDIYIRIMAFFILHYISKEILVSQIPKTNSLIFLNCTNSKYILYVYNFFQKFGLGEVGGINFDYVKFYIPMTCLLGQVVLNTMK